MTDQKTRRYIDADEFLQRALGTKCFRNDYALMLTELVSESITFSPDEIKSGINDATDLARIAIALRKLLRYEYAEQDGRLVVLPCKVGDTVYQKDHCGEIYEAVVQSVVIDKRRTIFITSGIGFDETSVGKTVFLTRAEAEAAMKGVSEDA